MKSDWKLVSSLRETSISISNGAYSQEYVTEHNLEESTWAMINDTITSVWVSEPIEVRLDESGNIFYREITKAERRNQSEVEFETSMGTFVSHNRGEFGGELVTPKDILHGNFVKVFECAGRTYAIDSCNHMGLGHMNIFTFTDDMDVIEIYSSKPFSNDGPSEYISFKALYVDKDKVYILASGNIDFGYIENKRSRKEKAYLFEILNDGIIKRLELDYDFGVVVNMIISNDKMIVGMDKVVAIVDLKTKAMRAFTPISVEAEQDITNLHEKLQAKSRD